MEKNTALPRPGQLLRELITAAGYRKQVETNTHALDGIANENRATIAELIFKVEEKCVELLEAECGHEWAAALMKEWKGTKQIITWLPLNYTFAQIPADKVREDLIQVFQTPLIDGMLRELELKFTGPDLNQWWDCPFEVWLAFFSEKADLTIEKTIERLETVISADSRTISRWRKGEKIEQIRRVLGDNNQLETLSYRSLVVEMIRLKPARDVIETDINTITGWLLMAVSCQSIPCEVRHKIQEYSTSEIKTQYKPTTANIDEFNVRAAPFVERFNQLCEEQPYSFAEMEEELLSIEEIVKDGHWEYRYIYEYFSAFLAASKGLEEEALTGYRNAYKSALWIAGPHQKDVLWEALIYSLGIKKNVEAKFYWDQTFVIGIYNPPKKPLNDIREYALEDFKRTFKTLSVKK